MTTRDSERIARQWNREIEAEIRREAARGAADGPWRAVGWTALWLIWLVLLAALVGHFKSVG